MEGCPTRRVPQVPSSPTQRYSRFVRQGMLVQCVTYPQVKKIRSMLSTAYTLTLQVSSRLTTLCHSSSEGPTTSPISGLKPPPRLPDFTKKIRWRITYTTRCVQGPCR